MGPACGRCPVRICWINLSIVYSLFKGRTEGQKKNSWELLVCFLLKEFFLKVASLKNFCFVLFCFLTSFRVWCFTKGPSWSLAITTEHQVMKSTRNDLLRLEVVEAKGWASHFPSELYSFIHSDEIFSPSFFPLKHLVWGKWEENLENHPLKHSLTEKWC